MTKESIRPQFLPKYIPQISGFVVLLQKLGHGSHIKRSHFIVITQISDIVVILQKLGHGSQIKRSYFNFVNFI